jgi:amino acid transporter
MNLRGVRESGKFFAFPTYFGIGIIGLMVGVGSIQTFFGQSASLSSPPQTAIEELTLFLILRTVAAGCTAVTGMEVVSNSVKAFRHPESKNAATTMLHMSLILAALFMGITFLASHYGVLPKTDETIVSQLARLTFGTGALYYALQAGTMLLLVLAANSAFAAFPQLASLLARDGYMPRQMATFGDRLVFSNGIIILGIIACFLLVLFHGDTHALIPLYAVGVFTAWAPSRPALPRSSLPRPSLRTAPGSSFSSLPYWFRCFARSALITKPSPTRSGSRAITVLHFHDAISCWFPSTASIKRSFAQSITHAVVQARSRQ